MTAPFRILPDSVPVLEVLVPEVIDELYGLRPGTYDPRTGAVTLGGAAGAPVTACDQGRRAGDA